MQAPSHFLEYSDINNYADTFHVSEECLWKRPKNNAKQPIGTVIVIVKSLLALGNDV